VFSRKVLSAYSGPALRVSRASDGSPIDIPFNGSNTNESAITTHCAGTTGTVRALYDQGPSANHLGQTIVSKQPQCFAAGALERMPNGVLAGRWPTVNSTHLLQLENGAGSAGIGGDIGITIGIAFARSTGESRLFELGTGVSGQTILVDAEITRKCLITNRAGNRQLNYTTTADLPHAWIFKRAAGSALSTWVIEENGVDLTQFTTVAPTTGSVNLPLASTQFILGNFVEGIDSFAGRIAAVFIFASLLGAADLALLRAELASYV
jgi:hypothetical protein